MKKSSTYLTGNIAFRMDEEMEKGLKLYFELADRAQIDRRSQKVRSSFRLDANLYLARGALALLATRHRRKRSL